LAVRRDPSAPVRTTDDLLLAARLQSNHSLTGLAREVVPSHDWTDLVLPADQMAALHDMSRFMRFQPQVFDVWGFRDRMSLGRGLTALFVGSSGTGKTLAAEILANDLGQALYRIDISAMVSKYIGETEKNLARVFAEAESSNSILFFDEADALFGKRTEVRDAHDRYANVGTAYLLQRIDEYDGVVILATNLQKNMDDAFVRRLRFIVEFPLPGPADRLRIWQAIWPPELPTDDDVDLRFLAERLEFAGGSIRNVAVAAAFLAASDGTSVGMRHVINATRREYQKTGKVLVGTEFGDYEALLSAEPGGAAP
jgi:SpoVK/Ycf46/Vps4 family AAA+-type ATPase